MATSFTPEGPAAAPCPQDRLFLTTKEWKEEWGEPRQALGTRTRLQAQHQHLKAALNRPARRPHGFSALPGGHKGNRAAAPFKRLPFHCCAITFVPFEDPVCTDDGTVYDITSIVPYIMKYKRHPV
jgi:hypothetical protein